ncbi:adenylate/guanylate cyclase domain-containing protein [Burkholderia cepacia]|uniref:adenylate/guanylate cyclase domain-containing protein n=1 Tax=Burkholderia cepacia TaxID=292 RepID=UPI000753B1CA|nr:adenylate/guanylate cyclase domain-containing protein [Burkholderia cepacia]KVW83226.1 transcriptional regulator [Burkholderia cepacia]KVX72426.1 transcriptional regulator [Burkholderia cepacia]
MSHTWKHDHAAEQIDKRIKDVDAVEIVDYVRDTDLESIPTAKAYKVDGVHLYADILNLEDMLHCTEVEGETCHKRTLRFLNQHFRAVDRILARTDAKRVDFHNQRLHALISKPYNTQPGAQAARVRRAVAIAQLVIDVLKLTGDSDEHIPAGKVRVGIDSGLALAVNNGRNGYREPLFLGEPANHAAKIANGTVSGIFLTNAARVAIGLDTLDDPSRTALTRAEIEACENEAALGVTVQTIVGEWQKDMENNPIGAFQFSRHTPPFRTMDIATLTPGNSRRQEALSIYADIDGFTRFVSRHIDESPEDVVKALHVIRAELERVLTSDFDGRRIRFIGDCVHGLLCEGTAQTTDAHATISTGTLCAGALRSSFNLALEKLRDAGVDTDGLGLAIGFEYGFVAVSRLGLKGDRVRCAVSRGVLASEHEQTLCNGTQTGIGRAAYDNATQAVRDLFGKGRRVSRLDFNEATEALSSSGDNIAKAVRSEAMKLAAPAVPKSVAFEVRPHCAKQ